MQQTANSRRVTIKTTDDRFNFVVDNEWWDTTGIDIVPQSVVDAYLDQNPRVGICVIAWRDDD